jgi:hypothetical protein
MTWAHGLPVGERLDLLAEMARERRLYLRPYTRAEMTLARKVAAAHLREFRVRLRQAREVESMHWDALAREDKEAVRIVVDAYEPLRGLLIGSYAARQLHMQFTGVFHGNG